MLELHLGRQSKRQSDKKVRESAFQTKGHQDWTCHGSFRKEPLFQWLRREVPTGKWQETRLER